MTFFHLALFFDFTYLKIGYQNPFPTDLNTIYDLNVVKDELIYKKKLLTKM